MEERQGIFFWFALPELQKTERAKNSLNSEYGEERSSALSASEFLPMLDFWISFRITLADCLFSSYAVSLKVD